MVPSWRISAVIDDIDMLKGAIQENRIKLIRRLANKAADWVAIQSREGMCPVGWLKMPPSSLGADIVQRWASCPTIYRNWVFGLEAFLSSHYKSLVCLEFLKLVRICLMK